MVRIAVGICSMASENLVLTSSQLFSQKICLLGVVGTSFALPQPPDPSIDAVVESGTFQDPAARVRPKFRYWIPDASVDPEVVINDVHGAGVVGAGGLELLAYYLYGGPPSNGAGRGTYAPVDWAKYGFGTPAWGWLDVACGDDNADGR